MKAFDFAADGWRLHEDDGFLNHVGPIWERQSDAGLMLAFQSEKKHANLRGVVQGGMLMTVADRLLGMHGRLMNEFRPQATMHLDVHFLAPVKMGDVVIGTARVRKNTPPFTSLKAS
ncbi:PaaI family thioesterase [Pantanalinema rosaneae CENA516]|uniref:PaaI family thioesterase n=1 Tax=Pantanalinema rosaneae TaxID=1620701 RepID=UPI003D6DEDC4